MSGPAAYRLLYSHDMKTTLDLNDQLLADAKSLAAQQRSSLTRLIEEGLQLRLRAQATGLGRRQLSWPQKLGAAFPQQDEVSKLLQGL